MPDVARHIPPADQWEDCHVPALRDAHRTLAAITATSAFIDGPPRHRDEWQYVRERLLDANGAFYPQGIEGLAGRHLQRVLVAAAMQQLWHDVVDDPTAEAATRARLRSCACWGSAHWQQITSLSPATEMEPHAFVYNLQGRLGAPRSGITLATRCIGCNPFSVAVMLANPPCHVGTSATPRLVTQREWLDGVHFDWERGGGHAVWRHNRVSFVFAKILSKLGYSVKVAEIWVGNAPGPNGKPQRIDGLAKNAMAGSGVGIGFDATVGSANLRTRLKKAADEGYTTTRQLEKVKTYLKGQPTKRQNLEFLAVALDSNSALGEQARDVVQAGYAARLALAKTDGERWAIALECQGLLAELSAAVQKGNAAIFFANARPVAGGFMHAAPVPLDADR